LGPRRQESVAHSDRFTVGAQSLAELAFAPRLGLYFWITAGYVHERLRQRASTEFFTSNAQGATTQQTTPFADQRRHGIEAMLFVPLTFHVSDSVALGLGPSLRWRGYLGRGEDASSNDSVHLGASSWIGASF
jgi:hypothetical protein